MVAPQRGWTALAADSSWNEAARPARSVQLLSICLRVTWEEVRVEAEKRKKETGKVSPGRLSFLGVMEKLSAMGAGGGARSYSDFMRSLAAKYNNNECVFFFFCFCLWDIVFCHISDGFVVTPLGRRLMRNWFR